MDVALAFRDAARGAHQQREGKVGGGVGEDTGRIPDRQLAGGGGGDVDIVKAHRHLADDLELRGGIHQFGIDLVRQQAQQAVHFGGFGLQHFIGRGQFILPDFRVAGFLHQLEALLRDDAGHKNFRFRQRVTSGCYGLVQGQPGGR